MASSKGKPGGKGGRSALQDVVAREYTIHLHKRVRLTNSTFTYCRSAEILDEFAPKKMESEWLHDRSSGEKSCAWLRREVRDCEWLLGEQRLHDHSRHLYLHDLFTDIRPSVQEACSSGCQRSAQLRNQANGQTLRAPIHRRIDLFSDHLVDYRVPGTSASTPN